MDPLWDLGLTATLHTLMTLITEGCIDAIFGGPPCATWSRLRYRPGGPAPLRRRGDQNWGLYGLRGWQLKELRIANTLMVNMLALMDALAARGGLVGMEHPEDPVMDPYLSILSTE